MASETAVTTTQGTLNVVPLGHDAYACIDVSGAGNTGFIVGSRHVLVVDTRLIPAMARELSAAIRSVTDKPVTYVADTHFHGDHTFGNQVFADGAEIIGSTKTRNKLLTDGESHLKWIASMYEADYSEVVITPPDTVFDGSMTIDLGGRSVELAETAAGHTGGDVQVWVPDAQVLFTGDVLTVNNIPWMGDSPSTARLMKDLVDLTTESRVTFVPDHGPNATTVQRESIYSLLGFLADLREQVTRLVDDEGASLGEVISRLDFSRYAGWRHLDNEAWMAGNITRLYEDIADEKQ